MTEKYSQFPQLLTVPEVALILKTSRSMAYLLVQRGEIPSIRISHLLRVRKEDLQRYIENNTNNEYAEVVGA
jgi:excisionase family DNA binding protein